MKILGLETSCDETAAAVVRDGRHVLSNVISSQASFHATYGGVIPEMAARQHLETVNYVIDHALKEADCTLDDIDAFAATLGPGLIGALLVGANAAKTLSFLTQKPFLGVNHLYAHVASNYLSSDLAPPYLCLLVSGGHTQLLHVADYDDIHLLGQTRDDAVGEAYDKVARLLNLPYPGGPELDRLAQQGNPDRYPLPQAKTSSPLDFSFSGLKTAALRTLEAANQTTEPNLSADLAASFQAATSKTLVQKTCQAAESLGLSTIAVAGGVAANTAIRKGFEEALKTRSGWRLFVPPLTFCTDHAAMVAASAFFNPISHHWGDEVFSRTKPTAIRATHAV